jgi:uncharacterized protein (TIGR03067 family)
MFRMLAALLFMNGATAWAQNSQVGDDQKQLQGIWIVREGEATATTLPTHLVFEGNKLLLVTQGVGCAEVPYRVDPTKSPKPIDLIWTVFPPAVPGQKAPAVSPVITPGIYTLGRNRLKIHFSWQPGRRPVDFSSAAQAGIPACVLILERDTSIFARRTVQEARAISEIRRLGGEAFTEDNRLGAPTNLYIKLDKSSVDELLTKIAPQLKILGRVTELRLDGSKVTDAGLAALEGINNLERINLEQTAITDAGLDHLRNMTTLTQLNLNESQVTPAGVHNLLKSLPQLRVTRLSHAESHSELAITNAGGTQDSDENGKLIEIRFRRGKLNDFQLLGLQKQLEVWKTTLRSIDLTDCHISDRGLAALASLTSLRQLTLKGTDVTVAGVNTLKRTLPHVKVLH